jgi:transposase
VHFLRRQIEQVEKQIEHGIKNSPLWQAKRELLESMPAIGKVSSSTLLARLPELGQFTRQKICALVQRCRGSRATSVSWLHGSSGAGLPDAGAPRPRLSFT